MTELSGDALWRFELCERIGMSCAAGHTWTVDEVYAFIREQEEKAMMYGRRQYGKELVEISTGGRKAAISGTDTLLRVQGKKFRCECGANVFSKTLTGGYYRCNGCDAGYESEPA